MALAIGVVPAARMRVLHARSFGIRRPTDVLAWPLGRKRGRLVGEIAVCYEVARRESRKRRHPLHAELALYVVHGILHLAGYDDHAPKDRLRMWRRQSEILSGLGIRLNS